MSIFGFIAFLIIWITLIVACFCVYRSAILTENEQLRRQNRDLQIVNTNLAKYNENLVSQFKKNNK